MASTSGSYNSRPEFSGHNSFNGVTQIRQPIEAKQTRPSLTYVGLIVTPNETQHDDRRGTWYRARTRVMTATQRNLELLVRKQGESDLLAPELLYDPQMRGSKREHIIDVIAERDNTFSDYKHELAYLKLERDLPEKGSKKSGRKILSMQVVLECRLRSCPPLGLSLHAPPLAPNQSNHQEGLTKPVSDHQLPNTVTSVPMAKMRPQYLPPYAQPVESQLRQATANAVYFPSPTPQAPTLPSTKRDPLNCDGDSSLGYRSASPSSIASSDGARGAPLTASGSYRSHRSQPLGSTKVDVDNGSQLNPSKDPANKQIENITSTHKIAEGTSPQLPQAAVAAMDSGTASVNEPAAHMDQSGEQALANFSRNVRRSMPAAKRVPSHTQHTVQCNGPRMTDPPLPRTYTSSSTQTNPVTIIDNVEKLHMKPTVNTIASTKHIGQTNNEDEATSIEESGDDAEPAAKGLTLRITNPETSDKPAWMENMQPVFSPKMSDENVDPFDDLFEDISPSKDHHGGAINPDTLPTSPHGRDPESEPNGLATVGREGFPQSTQQVDDMDPLSKAQNTTIGIAHNNNSSLRSDITMSGYLLGLPNHIRSRNDSMISQSSRDNQITSTRDSGEISPKQRKRVTFNLDTPVSTVPSTPFTGSPRSSLDSSSSSDTSDYTLTPPTPVAPGKPDAKASAPSPPELPRSTQKVSNSKHSTPNKDRLPPHNGHSNRGHPQRTYSGRTDRANSETSACARPSGADGRHPDDRFDRRHSYESDADRRRMARN